MKVRQIRLSNFKRFSDTTVEDIPQTARLILLVGPNGSGKSSLIEAVHWWYRNNWSNSGVGRDESYVRKQIVGGGQERVTVTFHEPQPVTQEDRRKAVYVRTAYRNDP